MTDLADVYDAAYYGAPGTTPKGNYRGYTADREPYWSEPLADLLLAWFAPPFLDVGGAYGHLARALSAKMTNYAIDDGDRYKYEAHSIDISAYTYANRLHGRHVQGDARNLSTIYGPEAFRTIISMDLIEHFTELDSVKVIAEMTKVAKRPGYLVFLVGTPEYDPHHFDDDTHLNHRPLSWYKEVVEGAGGWKIEQLATEAFNTFQLWRNTDWNGRWLCFYRGR